MRDFRGANILNGEVSTIAHLGLIGAIIRSITYSNC
jgi:hypothetical protein